MSTTANNLEVIAKFITELNVPGCDRITIRPDSHLSDDLGLNSLAVLLMIVWIKDNVNEEVFNHVEDVNSLVKVSDVLALMDK